MPSSTGPTPWHAHLTIDLLAKVLQRSIFHPFIAWLIPLCQRAVATPYSHPAIRLTMAWAVVVCLFWVLAAVDRRVAYGLPRRVRFSESDHAGADGDVDADDEEDEDEDEVVVITGGASGVGRLIAEVYGLRGVGVAVLDVRDPSSSSSSPSPSPPAPHALKNVDGELDERGVRYYLCDVGDRKQVESVAGKIKEDIGTPTILINGAAIVHGKSLLELSAEDVERSIRVNLLAHFHTIQTFLPGMLRRERGGTIVTISSVLGHLGCRNLADYTAAKAGLIALHESLKAELPPSSNVKTVLVTPGQISTPLFAGVQTPSTFLGPVLEPVEVAKAIIAAIDAGVSDELAMPLYARWIRWISALPVGVQRILRDLSAMDKAMQGFVGRRSDQKKRI